MDHFGTLSPRIAAYRESLLHITPSVCTDRAMLVTAASRAHEQDPVVLRRAYMLQAVLEMSIEALAKLHS